MYHNGTHSTPIRSGKNAFLKKMCIVIFQKKRNFIFQEKELVFRSGIPRRITVRTSPTEQNFFSNVQQYRPLQDEYEVQMQFMHKEKCYRAIHILSNNSKESAILTNSQYMYRIEYNKVHTAQ